MTDPFQETARIPDPADVLIVGCGMAGLTAARTLQQAGRRVLLVDKGRGVGGRLATRRIGHGRGDHGVPGFQAQHPAFREQVEQWAARGWVRPWEVPEGLQLPAETSVSGAPPRWIGIGGMNAWARELAEGLLIRRQTRIRQVHAREHWELVTDEGECFRGRALILTPPVPQSRALFAPEDLPWTQEEQVLLEQVAYAPCLAVLVALEQASRIDGPGIVTSRDLPSQTLIDNALKGVVQDRGTVLTLLADPAWSQRWLEGTAIEGVDLMLQGAGRWLGSVPLATHVHRWRHAFALRTHPAPCVQASHPLPMVWCGDGFGTETLPGVETAWVSGMAAARAVLERT